MVVRDILEGNPKLAKWDGMRHLKKRCCRRIPGTENVDRLVSKMQTLQSYYGFRFQLNGKKMLTLFATENDTLNV